MKKDKLSNADVLVSRKVLKHIRHSGKYFAYCVDDGTFIWHQDRGPWRRDDDAAQFLAFAREVCSDEQARIALEYFKRCLSTWADAATKAQRLNPVPKVKKQGTPQ